MSHKLTDSANQPEDAQIAELIDMLDSFMERGGGHMNVICEDGALANETVVETFRSADCSCKDMACSIPTLHKGFDDDDE